MVNCWGKWGVNVGEGKLRREIGGGTRRRLGMMMMTMMYDERGINDKTGHRYSAPHDNLVF